MTLLKFCACDFFSLSCFDFCSSRTSFVDVALSSFYSSMFCLINSSFVSSLLEHVEDAISFAIATIFYFSIVKISSQINDKIYARNFSLCSNVALSSWILVAKTLSKSIQEIELWFKMIDSSLATHSSFDWQLFEKSFAMIIVSFAYAFTFCTSLIILAINVVERQH